MYTYGLGAATAERMTACESFCHSAFDNANRRSKCTSACAASVNSGNCDGQCNPVFDTASRRTKCTLACKKSWLPGLVAALLPDPIPDVETDTAPGAAPNLSKYLPIAAIVGGIGILAYLGLRKGS